MATDRRPSSSSSRGAITLVALCLTTAMGIALGSYLALCHRSNQFSARSLQTERARELAHIGLEEALWAMNNNTWTASGPAGATAWTTSGANRTVTLTYSLDAQATGSVALTVANYASTGPATWPTITAAATLTLASGEVFTKTLQAATAFAPLFANAIASAQSYVSFAAGGTVDSYVSDPDNNTANAAVVYSFTTGAAANYAAVVAGNTDGTNGVILSQAEVRGYVATLGLPISYSTSGSPPGKVLGPTTASGVNVDPSRIGKSAFIPTTSVFTVNTPSAGSGSTLDLLLGLLSLVGQLLDALLGTIKVSGDLLINSSNETYIPILNQYPSLVINRPVKLIVTGDLTIQNTGHIRITTNGSLELFVGGNVTIGAGGFNNETNDPSKLAVYSTSSSTSDPVILNTAEKFCGVIYSENRPIVIQHNTARIDGALLSRNSIRFNGTAPAVHYDTSLRLRRFSGVTTPYVTRQVTEL